MNEPHPTRQRLLEQGLLICREQGLRGLKVRELAAAAGVNLGSFVYHFGNREQFLDELVELWYAPLFAALSQTTQAHDHDSPRQRLEAVLEQLIALVAANAPFVSQLLADTLAGETAARRFALKLPWRHPRLILQLIADAQRAGEQVQDDPRHLMMFLMLALGMPMLLAAGPLRDCSWLPDAAQPLIARMADPATARQRLSWAVQGLKPVAIAPHSPVQGVIA